MMTQPTPEVRKTEQYLVGPPNFDVRRVTRVINMATSVHGTPVLYPSPADAISANNRENHGRTLPADARVFKVTIEEVGTVA